MTCPGVGGKAQLAILDTLLSLMIIKSAKMTPPPLQLLPLPLSPSPAATSHCHYTHPFPGFSFAPPPLVLLEEEEEEGGVAVVVRHHPWVHHQG
jgi:hypothetical protein